MTNKKDLTGTSLSNFIEALEEAYGKNSFEAERRGEKYTGWTGILFYCLKTDKHIATFSETISWIKC
tara:strand:+ start:1654 stop:1854 length:201 start_codon:yes stop_codon:yes gene_type:complete